MTVLEQRIASGGAWRDGSPVSCDRIGFADRSSARADRRPVADCDAFCSRLCEKHNRRSATSQATGPHETKQHRFNSHGGKPQGRCAGIATVRGRAGRRRQKKNAEAGSSGAWLPWTAHRGPASAEGDENLKRGFRLDVAACAHQRDRVSRGTRRESRDGDDGFARAVAGGYADWFGNPQSQAIHVEAQHRPRA